MLDTHAYDGRIDRGLRERSPSGGWREVASVMHTDDAHLADEGIDLEDDESMLHDPTTTDPEVSTWS